MRIAQDWALLMALAMPGVAAAAIPEHIGSWLITCPGNTPCAMRFDKRLFDKSGVTGDLEIDADGNTLVPVLALRGLPSDVLAARLHQDPSISCINVPVDAASVPESLRGFRTIFSSFHHFPDTVAREVLGDAVRRREGFAMAEVTSRTPRAFATMLLMPILVWLLTPFMRPFRWSRLLLTYFVPLIPLVVFWDGVVSCFRTRTPQELLELSKTFPQYEWTAGYAKGGWLSPVYLIGHPK